MLKKVNSSIEKSYSYDPKKDSSKIEKEFTFDPNLKKVYEKKAN